MVDIPHITQGGFDIWCLTDGHNVFGADVFPSLSDAEIAARLAAAGATEIATEFNAFLLRDAAGVYTLIDTGCGTAFGPKAGNLIVQLAALGVDPDAISSLVLTHLHTDHCGGALRDGAAVFAQATIYLHADEAAYWAQEDHLAAQVLAAYEDQIQYVADGDVIAPGMVVRALPGHTPGHIGVMIADTVYIAADILHSEALQLPDPETGPIYDMDPDAARRSRKAALQEIVARNLIFSGGHILGPQKFARLVESDGIYTKVAA